MAIMAAIGESTLRRMDSICTGDSIRSNREIMEKWMGESEYEMGVGESGCVYECKAGLNLS